MGERKMQRDEKEKYTIAVAGMGYVGLSIATLRGNNMKDGRWM